MKYVGLRKMSMLSWLKKAQERKWESTLLFVIIAVGIFLRTYNLHEWLEFRGDQVRDAYLVDRVIAGESAWPSVGPFLSHTAVTEAASFHLGPIYYYFQIIAAKLFGNQPDVLAYPDVLFSILSIPLLYFLLRSYFKKNISLSITGLYSLSAYIIHYSRYAWSSNSIPFFVLLFLFSLFKTLGKNEKNRWLWAVFLGIALGVGFQLHAITMILFSVVAFLVFLFSLKKDRTTWKTWAVVFSVFVVLNSAQIRNEIRTGLTDTKAFIHFFSQNDNQSNENVRTFFGRIGIDAECHIQANFLYLSSYDVSFNRSNCTHDFSKITGAVLSVNVLKNDILFLFSHIFSIVGYFLLGYFIKNEKEESKKDFLRLMALYIGVGFLIMLPLSSGQFDDLRYFNFIFFVPYILLALMVKALSEKSRLPYKGILISMFFIILAISNVFVLSMQASKLLSKNATISQSPVLGEMELMVDYMVSHSNGQKNIHLRGDSALLSYTVIPLKYLLKKQAIDLTISRNENNKVPDAEPTFYMSSRAKTADMTNNYQKIGKIYIYRIDSE